MSVAGRGASSPGRYLIEKDAHAAVLHATTVILPGQSADYQRLLEVLQEPCDAERLYLIYLEAAAAIGGLSDVARAAFLFVNLRPTPQAQKDAANIMRTNAALLESFLMDAHQALAALGHPDPDRGPQELPLLLLRAVRALRHTLSEAQLAQRFALYHCAIKIGLTGYSDAVAPGELC